MVCCAANGTLDVSQQESAYPTTTSVPCTAPHGVAALVLHGVGLTNSLPGAAVWAALAPSLQVLDFSGAGPALARLAGLALCRALVYMQLTWS